MALIEREKKTKNSKKNYKIQNPKILLELLLGREKKLKITKKLQNTKSQKYNVIYASRQQYPVYLFCFFLFRGDHVKCFAAIIPIFFLCPAANSSYILYTSMREEKKKTKNPKKNYKTQNTKIL